MTLILYSGGRDSQELLDRAMTSRIKHRALQFYSQNIKRINGAGISNIYILGASDTTEESQQLLRQNNSYMHAALGFAMAVGACEVQVGLIDEDFDKQYLSHWLQMFVDNITYIGKMNGIKVVFPLLNNKRINT